MSEREVSKIYLNYKKVPLFNIDNLLKGYEPTTKEDDIWDEVEEE